MKICILISGFKGLKPETTLTQSGNPLVFHVDSGCEPKTTVFDIHVSQSQTFFGQICQTEHPNPPSEVDWEP